MKSASQISMDIRRKKKEMEDSPEIIDNSGASEHLPMDATDLLVMDNNNLTKELGLDDHEVKDHDEDPMVKHMAEGGMAEEPMRDDEMKMKRMARLKMRMGR